MKRRGQSGMLMGARPNSRRQTHLNPQDLHPASHESHLTAKKVPYNRERSNIEGVVDHPNIKEQSGPNQDHDSYQEHTHANVLTRAQNTAAEQSKSTAKNNSEGHQARKSDNKEYNADLKGVNKFELKRLQEADPTLDAVRAKAEQGEVYYVDKGILLDHQEIS
ncbi:hypothetical protein ElyMa_000441400 [Elysia marginata]|uniref:Uncharacterized protein n=1 Tax=Elysia marginata TaxID=1093978 RepID=A0AAV4FNB9_9GAST|nr:hypothetical protein ElyMa_000441400 [Elysia marginata]